LDVLFRHPFLARERWEIFALGQRLNGVEQDSPDVGLMLRGARRHPALAQMLDRIGVSSPALVLSLHRTSARLFEGDQTGVRGELGAWQGALAIVERAALSGDPAGAEAALSSLAHCSSTTRRQPARFRLVRRNALHAPRCTADAERMVLQVMSGALTAGRLRGDLLLGGSAVFFGPCEFVRRMEQRVQRRQAHLLKTRVAWRIARR
jgi:hypothetical protein